MTRHYYAEYRHYGLRNISDCDMLMQFQTKEERDAKVEQINNADYFNPRAWAVTVREASQRYRINDFNDLDRCHEAYDKTSYNRPYFEIHTR